MFRRWIIYPLEALGLLLLYGTMAALPVDTASALGGKLVRWLGPRLHVHRTALANLRRVFPRMSDAEIEAVAMGMWDNLGRVAAEHPHLDVFDPYAEDGRVTIVGKKHLDAVIASGKAGVFFAGHLGNWELSPLAMTKRGEKLHLAYRALNNPLADRIVRLGRGKLGAGLFPKGAAGARMALKALGAGEHVAMLVDQKMNDGIAVPFLGIDAMTAPATAQFAYRYDAPVIPVRVERLEGARFRTTFYPPLEKPDTGDRQKDIAALMAKVNEVLGAWITERPDQWLWIHRRWPESTSD